MQHYKYIIAPNTESNRQLFDSLLAAFPELLSSKRYSDSLWRKLDTDWVDSHGNVHTESEHALMIIAREELFQDNSELLSQVESPELYNWDESDLIIEKYWLSLIHKPLLDINLESYD